ncbi:MAG: TatD family hydrolase [Porticoccaceae bacterium]|nr:TatD family hydrolase [Porticoccaceae bacterium]
MTESLIDIGVNLSNNRFKNDIEDSLQRALDANVTQIILTGTSVAESEAVIHLCEKYEQLYPNMLFATVGVHPHHANEYGHQTLTTLEELANHKAVVAIGETGLDFNRKFSSESDQIAAFESQLELASNTQMPLFMHERDAAKRQLEILRDYRDHFTQGVIHCFTGDPETLFSYLDLDLHIGITGWICDEKRGRQLRSLISNIPLNRLMIETDAPYLLPKNIPEKPKSRRNEPSFLPWVLKEIANFREETLEELARETSATAKKMFNI